MSHIHSFNEYRIQKLVTLCPFIKLNSNPESLVSFLPLLLNHTHVKQQHWCCIVNYRSAHGDAAADVYMSARPCVLNCDTVCRSPNLMSDLHGYSRAKRRPSNHFVNAVAVVVVVYVITVRHNSFQRYEE